jgi:hypothetical protein
MDQVDGRQRSRSIRAKFTLPLTCCFGNGSHFDAEVTIFSNETLTDAAESANVTKSDATTGNTAAANIEQNNSSGNSKPPSTG